MAVLLLLVFLVLLPPWGAAVFTSDPVMQREAGTVCFPTFTVPAGMGVLLTQYVARTKEWAVVPGVVVGSHADRCVHLLHPGLYRLAAQTLSPAQPTGGPHGFKVTGAVHHLTTPAPQTFRPTELTVAPNEHGPLALACWLLVALSPIHALASTVLTGEPAPLARAGPGPKGAPLPSGPLRWWAGRASVSAHSSGLG
jgi:hypothetical protein